MVNGQDFDMVAVSHVGRKPSALYFFPVITFLVLLYFKMMDIPLDSGFISAMLGVSIVSVIVNTAFVGFGIITEEWYTVETRTSHLWGEILIAILSLVSTAFTFWVIGLSENAIPTLNNLLWFIYGFIFYQLMWVAFNSFYKFEMFPSQRLNVALGVTTAVTLGVFSVYFAFIMGIGGI